MVRRNVDRDGFTAFVSGRQGGRDFLLGAGISHNHPLVLLKFDTGCLDHVRVLPKTRIAFVRCSRWRTVRCHGLRGYMNRIRRS